MNPQVKADILKALGRMPATPAIKEGNHKKPSKIRDQSEINKVSEDDKAMK